MTDGRTALITELEIAGHRAWPAAEVHRLHGWLLRADKGITRRANSVLPCTYSGEDPDADIDAVISFYGDRNLTPMFQVTEASSPRGLDAILDRRDFERELQVHVQTVALDGITDGLGASDVTITVSATITEDWLNNYPLVTGYDDVTCIVRNTIMARAPSPKAFALAFVDGRPAGVGFAVLDGQWVGLFGIAVHPGLRRRGVGTAVSARLMHWGVSKGATDAYLQVEVDNHPALALYKRLGFTTLYTYWYRLYPDSSA